MKKIIYLFFCMYSILFGIGTFSLIEENSFAKYYIVFLCAVSGIFYGYLFKNEVQNLW
jgi:hypothetical protein